MSYDVHDSSDRSPVRSREPGGSCLADASRDFRRITDRCGVHGELCPPVPGMERHDPRDGKSRSIRRKPGSDRDRDDRWTESLTEPHDTVYHDDVKRTRYYFAYGSNLNLAQMKRRCPGAVRVGPCALPNFRLVFRGVADIEPCAGECVQGAIYSITASDERALDRYEGFRAEEPDCGLYRKEVFLAEINGKAAEVMYYTMNARGYDAPSTHYYGSIAQGYADWKLPLNALEAALDHSSDRPTRRARRG